MLMTEEGQRPAQFTDGLSQWQEVGAIRECEEHGWMQDRSDPHARERALDIAARIRHLDSRRRQLPEPSRKFSVR